MGIINDLLGALLKKRFSEDVENRIEKALTEGVNDEDNVIDELAENYRCIIKKIKPDFKSVEIDGQDSSTVIIDGDTYDLDELFSHNNRKITECHMAVESLYADLTLEGYSQENIARLVEEKLTRG